MPYSSSRRVANYRFYAGLSDEQIIENIRKYIPNGTRRISNKEIWEAITKAKNDYKPYCSVFKKPSRKPTASESKISSEYRDRLLEKGKNAEEVDSWEVSPFRLLDLPEGDAELLFKTLYEPDDYLFFGTQYDTKVQSFNG